MKTGAIFSGYSARDYRGEALYAALALPPPPKSTNWCDKLTLPLSALGNEQYGDCVFASLGHLLNVWQSNTGLPYDVTENEIVADYLEHNDNRDVGAQLREVLLRFNGKKQRGRKKDSVASHRCAGFVRLRHDDLTIIEQAIANFGGAYIGIDMPSNWQDLETWATPAPRWRASGALHCVPLVDFDHAKGMFTTLTWGRKIAMSYGWFLKYCGNQGEAWAILSPDWWGGKAKAPSGLSIADAFTALKGLAA